VPLSSHPCLPYCWSRYKQQGLFAPRTLLRFFATAGPSATLSSSTDFPVFPVIRLPAPPISRTGRGGLLQLLGSSLSACCRYHPARVLCRLSQIAALHAAFAPSRRARPLVCTFSRPPVRSLSLRPADSLTILKMALSIDSRDSVSFLPTIPATRF
jgi:hypothetical protein